jgi:hypothetical protein
MKFALRLILPAAAIAVAPLFGCDLLGIEPTVDLPLPLETPPVDIDVGGPVDEVVASACANPADAGCQGFAALCRAENNGQDCDPVTLPAQLLKELDVNNDGTNETLDDILGDDLKEAARVQFAIPVDLTEALEGVNSPDQVEDVSFSDVSLAWVENSLTFDAPVLDVYVGPQSESLDPEALLASGDFTKVGTIGKDTNDDGTLDVGQEALTTGDVALEFVAGGNEAFNAALRSLAFTLVAAAPEGSSLELREVEADPTKVFRPDGEAKLSLKATLLYKVNLAQGVNDLTGAE